MCWLERWDEKKVTQRARETFTPDADIPVWTICSLCQGTHSLGIAVSSLSTHHPHSLFLGHLEVVEGIAWFSSQTVLGYGWLFESISQSRSHRGCYEGCIHRGCSAYEVSTNRFCMFLPLPISRPKAAREAEHQGNQWWKSKISSHAPAFVNAPAYPTNILEEKVKKSPAASWGLAVHLRMSEAARNSAASPWLWSVGGGIWGYFTHSQ